MFRAITLDEIARATGGTLVEGPHNEQVAKDMEKDAVSTSDDFHTQTALLNKISHLRGCLDISLEKDEAPRLGFAQERTLLRRQRRAGQTGDESARDHARA